jgi:hypothetical protein
VGSEEELGRPAPEAFSIAIANSSFLSPTDATRGTVHRR